MSNWKAVTCRGCIDRRAYVGKHSREARPSEFFRVGVPQGVSQSGHSMFYSVHGIIALCAAGRLQPQVRATPKE